jgi:hypothetical protein
MADGRLWGSCSTLLLCILFMIKAWTADHSKCSFWRDFQNISQMVRTRSRSLIVAQMARSGDPCQLNNSAHLD